MRNLRSYIINSFQLGFHNNHLLRVLLIASCLLINIKTTAQIYPIQVTPQLIPPYSLKLSDYQTTASEKLYVNLLLTDTQESARQVRLKLYIEGQGLNIQSPDFMVGSPPIFLDGGVNLRLSNLDLRSLFSLNNLLGINSQQYNQPLPDGRYDFCFEVYDQFSGRQVSQKKCASVFLILNDPPILNLPNRGDLITAQNPQNIIFNWTPRHLNATGAQYEFTLKELWDTGVDPQAAFLNSPPLFQTTTFATTLLYGPAETQLLEGKVYSWQVRALVSDGISETSVFRNNGYSEIYHFRYEGNCDVPNFVLSEAQNSQTVEITWNYSEHLRYEIQYRKKGYGDADWFSLYAYTQQSTIRNLEAGTAYEFRVGGECTPQGGFAFSTINEFITPTEGEEAYYNCGVLPEVEITNQNSLQNIGANEVFTAGDFPVTVKEATGENGIFTGWGFITVPYLGDTKIRVEFEGVHINTDFQLIEGVVKTTYDPNWEGVESIDEFRDNILGASGEIKQFDATDIDIATVQVNENGKIILIDENNKKIPIETDSPVIITDKNNDKWQVDENSVVTPLGKGAAGGSPTSDNTDGIANNGKVTQISSPDVSVVFSSTSFYSSDKLRDGITNNSFIKNYEPIPKASGGNYDVLYKAISNAPQTTDQLIATATLSNGKTTDDIVFKTKKGIPIPTKWSDNTATLTLTKQFDFAKDEILATVKPADATSKFKIAGKANIWHLQQKQVNVTIVPVGDATISNTIAQEINAIYNPVGVQLNVTIDSPIDIEQERWDENGDGQLDIGNSNVIENYTNEERAIYNNYQLQRPLNDKMYYIFVLGDDISTTDANTQGFMPLKRQYGFVFNPTNKSRTIAHELGHGIFGLEHPFTEYNITQGTTDLLMDYGSGTAFTHMDWQKIHAPGLKLYLFQGDEDGEDESVLEIPKNSKKVLKLITAIKEANESKADTLLNVLKFWKESNNLYEGDVNIDGKKEINLLIIHSRTDNNISQIINTRQKSINSHPHDDTKEIFEFYGTASDGEFTTFLRIQVKKDKSEILADYLYGKKTYLPWLVKAIEEGKAVKGGYECGSSLYDKGKEYHQKGANNMVACPCSPEHSLKKLKDLKKTLDKEKYEKYSADNKSIEKHNEKYKNHNAKPWCASFLNWCLKEVKAYNTNSASSQSFATDTSRFVKIDEPVLGAIMVNRNYNRLSDDYNSTFGHVTIVVGRGEGKIIYGLGGNQTNTIKVSRYHLELKDKYKRRGYYIPADYQNKLKEYEMSIPTYSNAKTANLIILNLNIESTKNESTY